MSLFLTKLVFLVLFCFVFYYLYALAFPLLSTSAKTLKLSRIETRLCCRFFSLKVWMAKTRQALAQSKKKKKITLAFCGAAGRAYMYGNVKKFSDACVTKFCYSWCSLRARESSTTTFRFHRNFRFMTEDA